MKVWVEGRNDLSIYLLVDVLAIGGTQDKYILVYMVCLLISVLLCIGSARSATAIHRD